MLLTKCQGHTGRLSAWGLVQVTALGPYKKDLGPIFSQYGPKQAWIIRDLLYDWICFEKKNATVTDWKKVCSYDWGPTRHMPVSDVQQKCWKQLKKESLMFKARSLGYLCHKTTKKSSIVVTCMWDHLGQYLVQYWENIGLAMEQSDWLILVTGSVNQLSRVIKFVMNYLCLWAAPCTISM